MTPPWDPEALWMKARLFINYALEDGDRRPWDERALWASLALELLAKAALTRASPLLIASPNEEGTNLLVASGLVQGEAAFKSITARTAFQRCGRAFKPFNAKAATRIAEQRNDYLHGAAPAFTLIPPKAWWPRYWAQALILVNACDRSLGDFVGESQVGVVEKALEQNAQNLQSRVAMLIYRARQKLARFKAGEMLSLEAEEWQRPRDFTRGGGHSSMADCPACGSWEGLLEGDEVIESEMRTEQISEMDFEAWVELEVAADYFSCDTCHLVLDSFELLDTVGLPTKIEAIGEPGDFWEPDYGND